MDPTHALAARQVHLTRAEPEDVDAFYDAHACAVLHDAKRAILRVARWLAEVRIQTSRSKIASYPGRA